MLYNKTPELFKGNPIKPCAASHGFCQLQKIPASVDKKHRLARTHHIILACPRIQSHGEPLDIPPGVRRSPIAQQSRKPRPHRKRPVHLAKNIRTRILLERSIDFKISPHTDPLPVHQTWTRQFTHHPMQLFHQ